MKAPSTSLPQHTSCASSVSMEKNHIGYFLNRPRWCGVTCATNVLSTSTHSKHWKIQQTMQSVSSNIATCGWGWSHTASVTYLTAFKCCGHGYCKMAQWHTTHNQHSNPDLQVHLQPSTQKPCSDRCTLIAFHFYIQDLTIYTSQTMVIPFSATLRFGTTCDPTTNARPTHCNPLPTALYICCFRGPEYHDSLGTWSHQWQFLHTLLYQD